MPSACLVLVEKENRPCIPMKASSALSTSRFPAHLKVPGGPSHCLWNSRVSWSGCGCCWPTDAASRGQGLEKEAAASILRTALVGHLKCHQHVDTNCHSSISEQEGGEESLDLNPGPPSTYCGWLQIRARSSTPSALCQFSLL